MLEDADRRIELLVLLREVTESDVHTDRDRSGGRVLHAGEAPQKRRLPGAVSPDHHEPVAAADDERHRFATRRVRRSGRASLSTIIGTEAERRGAGSRKREARSFLRDDGPVALAGARLGCRAIWRYELCRSVLLRIVSALSLRRLYLATLESRRPFALRLVGGELALNDV